MPRRLLAFAAITAACVLGGGVYVAVASLRPGETDSKAAVRAADGRPSSPLLVRAADASDPRLNGGLFRVTPSGARKRVGELACQRVHLRAGHGLCLRLKPSGVDYEGVLFDSAGRPGRRFGLTGVPDRARVSPRGRLAAFTTFESGHSYASPGQFSTRTGVLDTRTGKEVLELEELEVTRNEKRLRRIDFNFWGVTFTDEAGGFYATLGTGKDHYLIRGDARTRKAEVVRENTECPSLSPNGRRLAYKRRIADGGTWRSHVLDLRTGRDVALAEGRSIDDQLEWLDDETIVYGDDKDVFTVPADGSGRPLRVARGAASPAALR